MIAMRRLSLFPALFLALESASFGCAVLREEYIIGYSDAVVDGVAYCGLQRGSCRLVAREVIKEDDQRRTGSHVYVLRFEPGINERIRQESWESGTIWMCLHPWEPEAQRVEGRFYLDRTGGGYRVRQESARGNEEPGDRDAPEPSLDEPDLPA